jgi:hypothetical protein
MGRKGKRVGEGAARVFGVNISEILAIVAASIVLGVSISWQYYGIGFLDWVAINSIICLVAGMLHELTHRIFAHIFRLKIEYRFWTEGSVLTLISSDLGNAFSVQGFLLEEIPEDAPRWKVGAMKLAAPLVSAFVMVTFAAINVFFPSAVFQIIYTTSALWAMAEMLPFNGLDGKDIKEWSAPIWLASFVLIGIGYVFVMFVI